MSEADRLLQLLDDAIAAAKGCYFAHALKTKDLIALRALLAALVESK